MATNRSLRALREDLHLSLAYNMVDAEEFVLLCDVNQSKDIYPYWKYEPFDIERLTSSSALLY